MDIDYVSADDESPSSSPLPPVSAVRPSDSAVASTMGGSSTSEANEESLRTERIGGWNGDRSQSRNRKKKDQSNRNDRNEGSEKIAHKNFFLGNMFDDFDLDEF